MYREKVYLTMYYGPHDGMQYLQKVYVYTFNLVKPLGINTPPHKAYIG